MSESYLYTCQSNPQIALFWWGSQSWKTHKTF